MERGKRRAEFLVRQGRATPELVATCPVSRRVRKHRLECLSLAPQRNALTIDTLPQLKCFEMFWFPSDMEMEHFCHVKIFHRSDSLLLA